jgi:dolichyl-phosphate beta-glucosyltransferase
MDLSIIIPALNEERRLGPTLEEIRRFFDEKGTDYEVIVIDDGSRDRTSESALSSRVHGSGKLKLLKNEKNMGKGYSVKRGVQEATGELILFTDADLSTPVSEFDKLFLGIENGNDIAAGSRSIGASHLIKRQPLYRQTMGRTFNMIIRLILNEDLKDTQCGFKLIKKEAAKTLFGKMSINGFAFDAELFFLARKLKYAVEEIGVRWENSPDSRVHPVLSSLEMLRDTVRIRILHK